MALHASWIHGNALTVENPGSLDRVGHFGWGADMAIKPGQSSWFHIPLATPVIVGDVRSKVQRLFLMFSATSGSVRNVHIYDGSGKVQEFNNLLLSGEHRTELDNANTFDLSAPHTVVWGMGVSFFFVADIGFDTPIPDARLIVSSAGGDFFV
ncbi:hypothetical protein WJ47_25840 [Burkholderia ubonensis]|uniref:Uncharacterized protein n=1 Tax=Burkholderia ubonensis TaxID=101571 RepID=A0AB73FZQ7_9BURK|nr:DUF6623 family protein [Burkholderia ubonensis]KVC86001.1 hypothetical protein WI75_33000 [Burkholderia ubonensis]KVK82890.1 hypothetical protein WJ44_07510 [Burkholderia ubonensis]KVL63543.1 hypothetical protein WJ48_23865 [Burkholderia ubonensis]KVL66733.1 hypothetical protein WJ49_30020 [Burkholderia ubonensis]KVL80024.1 hypothetical protein WJ47_25840 [Burkholderia ubonensis]